MEEQSRGLNLAKWGCLSIAAIVGFLVIGVVALAIIGSQMPAPSESGAKHNYSEPIKVEKAHSESGSQQSSKSEAPAGNVQADVDAYYGAAASGNYDETYNRLTPDSQAQFSRAEWVEANTTLQSDQGTYEVTNYRNTGGGAFKVDLLVSGEGRTTTFVYDPESGIYEHSLTTNEIATFSEALSSASASASATPSPAPSNSGSGEVTVEVVVEASEPVDVSIFDDDFSTSINEQVTSETYTFTMDADSGLSASASTQDMTGGDISVQVYEDGKLVSEDQADGMALVQY